MPENSEKNLKDILFEAMEKNKTFILNGKSVNLSEYIVGGGDLQAIIPEKFDVYSSRRDIQALLQSAKVDMDHLVNDPSSLNQLKSIKTLEELENNKFFQLLKAWRTRKGENIKLIEDNGRGRLKWENATKVFTNEEVQRLGLSHIVGIHEKKPLLDDERDAYRSHLSEVGREDLVKATLNNRIAVVRTEIVDRIMAQATAPATADLAVIDGILDYLRDDVNRTISREKKLVMSHIMSIDVDEVTDEGVRNYLQDQIISRRNILDTERENIKYFKEIEGAMSVEEFEKTNPGVFDKAEEILTEIERTYPLTDPQLDYLTSALPAYPQDGPAAAQFEFIHNEENRETARRLAYIDHLSAALQYNGHVLPVITTGGTRMRQYNAGILNDADNLSETIVRFNMYSNDPRYRKKILQALDFIKNETVDIPRNYNTVSVNSGEGLLAGTTEYNDYVTHRENRDQYRKMRDFLLRHYESIFSRDENKSQQEREFELDDTIKVLLPIFAKLSSRSSESEILESIKKYSKNIPLPEKESKKYRSDAELKESFFESRGKSIVDAKVEEYISTFKSEYENAYDTEDKTKYQEKHFQILKEKIKTEAERKIKETMGEALFNSLSQEEKKLRIEAEMEEPAFKQELERVQKKVKGEEGSFTKEEYANDIGWYVDHFRNTEEGEKVIKEATDKFFVDNASDFEAFLRENKASGESEAQMKLQYIKSVHDRLKTAGFLSADVLEQAANYIYAKEGRRQKKVPEFITAKTKGLEAEQVRMRGAIVNMSPTIHHMAAHLADRLWNIKKNELGVNLPNKFWRPMKKLFYRTRMDHFLDLYTQHIQTILQEIRNMQENPGSPVDLKGRLHGLSAGMARPNVEEIYGQLVKHGAIGEGWEAEVRLAFDSVTEAATLDPGGNVLGANAGSMASSYMQLQNLVDAGGVNVGLEAYNRLRRKVMEYLQKKYSTENPAEFKQAETEFQRQIHEIYAMQIQPALENMMGVGNADFQVGLLKQVKEFEERHIHSLSSLDLSNFELDISIVVPQIGTVNSPAINFNRAAGNWLQRGMFRVGRAFFSRVDHSAAIINRRIATNGKIDTKGNVFGPNSLQLQSKLEARLYQILSGKSEGYIASQIIEELNKQAKSLLEHDGVYTWQNVARYLGDIRARLNHGAQTENDFIRYSSETSVPTEKTQILRGIEVIQEIIQDIYRNEARDLQNAPFDVHFDPNHIPNIIAGHEAAHVAQLQALLDNEEERMRTWLVSYHNLAGMVGFARDIYSEITGEFKQALTENKFAKVDVTKFKVSTGKTAGEITAEEAAKLPKDTGMNFLQKKPLTPKEHREEISGKATTGVITPERITLERKKVEEATPEVQKRRELVVRYLRAEPNFVDGGRNQELVHAIADKYTDPEKLKNVLRKMFKLDGGRVVEMNLTGDQKLPISLVRVNTLTNLRVLKVEGDVNVVGIKFDQNLEVIEIPSVKELPSNAPAGRIKKLVTQSEISNIQIPRDLYEYFDKDATINGQGLSHYTVDTQRYLQVADQAESQKVLKAEALTYLTTLMPAPFVVDNLKLVEHVANLYKEKLIITTVATVQADARTKFRESIQEVFGTPLATPDRIVLGKVDESFEINITHIAPTLRTIKIDTGGNIKPLNLSAANALNEVTAPSVKTLHAAAPGAGTITKLTVKDVKDIEFPAIHTMDQYFAANATINDKPISDYEIRNIAGTGRLVVLKDADIETRQINIVNTALASEPTFRVHNPELIKFIVKTLGGKGISDAELNTRIAKLFTFTGGRMIEMDLSTLEKEVGVTVNTSSLINLTHINVLNTNRNPIDLRSNRLLQNINVNYISMLPVARHIQLLVTQNLTIPLDIPNGTPGITLDNVFTSTATINSISATSAVQVRWNGGGAFRDYRIIPRV